VSGSKVTVSGLREFQAGMRGLGEEQKRALPAALKDVAFLLAQRIASRFPRGKTGRAARSVKPRAGQKGAGIAFGGAKAPHAPWLDFGGRVEGGGWGGNSYADRTYIGRPYGDGRYVYPTIVEEGEETKRKVADAFEQVARRHGFKVKGGGA
jgi:hypothetical protein